LRGDATYVDPAVIKVLTQADFTTAEPTQTLGNAHLNTVTGTSASAQAVTAGRIYRWDGTTWLETTPAEGQLLDDAGTDSVLRWDGAAWAELSPSAYVQAFVVADWSVPILGLQTLTILGATHNKGTTAVSRVQEGAAAPYTDVQTESQINVSGDITLVVADGEAFDGRVLIS